MSMLATATEADILEQLVAPTDADLPPDSARALLRFKFPAAALRTIHHSLKMTEVYAEKDMEAVERALLADAG